MKKRVLAGLAFVAAALALILILSIFRNTARAVEDEGPSVLGYLVIPGRAREEKPVRIHDKRTAVKAPERVEIVEEEQAAEAAPEVVLSDEDVDLLARITMAEAESESELGKRLVIDTVLNRMEDSRFPDTVSGVIYQPHQFSPVENGRLSRCYVQDEIRDLVLEECMTRTNRECLYFQRGSSCPWGTLLLHEGGHYFFM